MLHFIHRNLIGLFVKPSHFETPRSLDSAKFYNIQTSGPSGMSGESIGYLLVSALGLVCAIGLVVAVAVGVI